MAAAKMAKSKVNKVTVQRIGSNFLARDPQGRPLAVRGSEAEALRAGEAFLLANPSPEMKAGALISWQTI